MPSWMFEKTIFELDRGGFKGFIQYSIYNEPTMDPRLVYFIQSVNDILGTRGNSFVITNGSYMDQEIILDLYEAGMKTLWISCYTPEIFAEFQAYHYPEDLNVNVINQKQLEIISDTYTRDYIDSNKPCNAPLGQIVIRCNGDVHLCCRDYESRHIFGNLHNNTLTEIIEKGEMAQIHADLVQGKRVLDICRRCNTSF